MAFCPNCGNETDGNFCPNCGTKIPKESATGPVVEPATQFANNVKESDSNIGGPTALKTPFYKKKWFIVVAVLIVLSIVFGNMGGNSSEGDESPVVASTVESVGSSVSESVVETVLEPVATGISVLYTGDTKAGVMVDESNAGVEVTVELDDGTTVPAEGWTITEPSELVAGEVSSYEVAWNEFSDVFDVACTSLDEAEYEASCQTCTYDQLARTPDDFILSNIAVRGEVTQVVEGDEFTTLLVGITEGNYGIWTDIIYVQYTPEEGEARILEDDMVTMYGISTGIFEYETVMGAQKSVPSMSAYFIELG